MSYMDRENILSEGIIDNVIKLLSKKGRKKDVDKIKKDKKIQKNMVKLQKKIDDLNKNGKELERLFGIKYKELTVADFI